MPLRAEPECQPLTDESVEELLDRVATWYDAHDDGFAEFPSSVPLTRCTQMYR